MKHSSVAVGAAKEVLLLCRVRIVGRFDIHVCLVAVDFSADRTGAAAYQLRNFSKT